MVNKQGQESGGSWFETCLGDELLGRPSWGVWVIKILWVCVTPGSARVAINTLIDLKKKWLEHFQVLTASGNFGLLVKGRAKRSSFALLDIILLG